MKNFLWSEPISKTKAVNPNWSSIILYRSRGGLASCDWTLKKFAGFQVSEQHKFMISLLGFCVRQISQCHRKHCRTVKSVDCSLIYTKSKDTVYRHTLEVTRPVFLHGAVKLEICTQQSPQCLHCVTTTLVQCIILGTSFPQKVICSVAPQRCTYVAVNSPSTRQAPKLGCHSRS